MNKPFQHVVIIGCGLLGTSLGLALRRLQLAQAITGVGRGGSPSVAIARQRGAVDRTTEDPAQAVAGRFPGQAPLPAADLVVVCTPVRQFPEMFRRIAPALGRGAIVTDVGSTKSQVLEWAGAFLPPPPQAFFVGSHPMAGSEKNGPEAARGDLYENAVCLVCRPTEPLPALEEACARVLALWEALGMRVISCAAAQHDRWVASSSHLPHALAAALVNTVADDPAALETAAGGLVDTSRIASAEATMWTDIFLTNRPAVSAMLGQFQGQLAGFKDAIDRGDEGAIHAFLTRAKSARDAFMARRRNSTGGA